MSGPGLAKIGFFQKNLGRQRVFYYYIVRIVLLSYFLEKNLNLKSNIFCTLITMFSL